VGQKVKFGLDFSHHLSLCSPHFETKQHIGTKVCCWLQITDLCSPLNLVHFARNVPVVVYAVDTVLNVPTVGVVNDVRAGVVAVGIIGRLRHTFRSFPPFRHDLNPNDKL